MIDTTSLKILHIASGDLWAGAEVQLYTLVKSLRLYDSVAVNVILLNHGRLEEELISSGIDVTILDESRMNTFIIFSRINRIIRQLNPHIIHTHRQKENILGSLASLINGRIPCLRTVHGAPENAIGIFNVSKVTIRLLDTICGRLLQDKIISVSDDLAILLNARFQANKIHVIDNGIDIKSIRSHIKPRSKSIGEDDKVIKVGLAGRLVAAKRIDIFIKTARFLLDNYTEPRFIFYIFGDGPKRQDLEMLSERIGTKDIVFFEGHCDNIIDRIQEMDIVLMTSDHEGLPMILLEAIALEIPVIAHSVGGIPKLLNYGECGVLVEDHTPTGYGRAVYTLAAQHELRKTLTTKALNRLYLIYSSNKTTYEYLAQYCSLVKRII